MVGKSFLAIVFPRLKSQYPLTLINEASIIPFHFSLLKEQDLCPIVFD